MTLTVTEAAVHTRTWTQVCRLERLQVECGVAALVQGTQVALFRLDDAQVCAIGNLDPFSGANVLARGIVGSRGPVAFVASPMLKQPFDLRTGQCLDDAAVRVPTYDVRVVDGMVEVRMPARDDPAAGR
ncbi:MAG TPA: nitrite reductase small subunit NirD [Dermatophilaceae bacterium]|nr:nitrite reductase small subunit NirD [Dermatophilaceae bacterium]